MAKNVSSNSDFTETLVIHSALKSALKNRVFESSPKLQRAARGICKTLDSEKSIYGRQLKMINLMQQGASIAEMCKKLNSSRRTIFRYLNFFEEAGVDIKLKENKYYVDKNVSRLTKC